MDDRRIVELFLNRSEEALLQIDIKYGRYCHRVAFNVLGNAEDSEECVNDAYMRVWGQHSAKRAKLTFGLCRQDNAQYRAR